MLFNSLPFLVFFPCVFVLYYALPFRLQKYMLLLASYYFYMCWKPEFIVLILFSTLVDYCCYLGLALIVLIFGVYGPGYDVRAFAYFQF